MRYGCCINMVSRTPDVSGIDVLPVMSDLGFDYAEHSLTHLCNLDADVLKSIRTLSSGSGLPVEVCNNFFPSSIKLTGREVSINNIVNYLKKSLNIAANLGVKVIVFGSGPARMVPEGYSIEDARKQLIEILNLIDLYVADVGITVAIEPLRKAECNILNTYAEVRSLKKDISMRNIKCLLDYYHLREEQEDSSIILDSPGCLTHVHFAEPAGRRFPNSGNKQIYSDLFHKLSIIEYDHRLSIEAFTDDLRSDAKQALQLFRLIEEEISILND